MFISNKTSTQSVLRLAIILAFFVSSLLLVTQSTQAATFNVSCDNFDLINTINAANTNAESDVIILSDACVYTLTIEDNFSVNGANGLPIITTNITINGNSSIIERPLPNPNTFPAERFRFFQVAADGVLTLNNLTLRNGHNIDGIAGQAPVDSPFFGTAAGGGAILAIGDLVLDSVSLLNNRTGDGASSGGGGGSGGAVTSVMDSQVTIIDSLIDGNQTGEGLGSSGSAGFGGALSVGGDSIFIDKSTLSNNKASPENPGGASIIDIISAFPDTSFTLTRSTLSGNGQSVNGNSNGILFNSSLPNVEFTHNTFVNNESDFLLSITAGDESTIIRNNIFENTSGCSISSGDLDTVASSGNMFDNSFDTCGLINGVNNNFVGVDANVLPLAMNGGRNPTHDLPADSPARDRIVESIFFADQRGGIEYGQDGDVGRFPSLAVDIGAIEAIDVQAIRDNFSSQDNQLIDGRQQDWYSVTLAEGETISYSLLFTDSIGDVDTLFYNSNKLNIFLEASASSDDNESIEFTATETGEYWFVVYGFLSDINDYDLNVTIDRNEFCLPIKAANGNIALVCL